MKIPLPNKFLDRIERCYRPVGDWLNARLYKRMRRIDAVIALLGLLCIIYYWLVSGWQGALMGGLMFVFFVMLTLWVF